MTGNTLSQKIVRWLFHDDQTLSLKKLEWIKLLFAVMLKATRSFTRAFFSALQEKISEIEGSGLSDEQKDILRFNALSFLAFAHPEENDNITVKGINYTIHRIKLTSGWFSAPYYAYGLHSDTPGADSLLIFQGTTVPSDRGFLAGLLGDTRPVGAIGSWLYHRGKNAIHAWVASEYQRTGKPIIATGQSLGGAMSMLLHIHQPDAVDFFVFNPPSLTTLEENIYKGHTHQCQSFNDDERTLKVVTHYNDPVWSLGSRYLPPGTKVYKHGDLNINPILAHARTANFVNNTDSVRFETNDFKKQRNIGWKVTKSLLFPIVFLLQSIVFLPRLIIQLPNNLAYFHRNTNPTERNLIYFALALVTATLVVGGLGLPVFGILPASLAIIIGLSILLSSLLLTVTVIGLKIRDAFKPSITLEIDKHANSNQLILNKLTAPKTPLEKPEFRTLCSWERLQHKTVKINYNTDDAPKQSFFIRKKELVVFLNGLLREKNIRTSLLDLESTTRDIETTLTTINTAP